VSERQFRVSEQQSVDLHAHSEMHFDIDWLHIHDNKTWDKDVYASGTLPLEQKCLHQ
jgi:hypothetical protein